MRTNRVVLIGAQAQGKTTFFNKITNQQQKTQYAGQSCTRKIVQGTTIYGQGFEVIDTPGFDTSVDRLLHVSGILAALADGPVNRILIVVKYERDDSITKKLELVFKPVYRYKQIVTVILTHWDLCIKGQEDQEWNRIKVLITNQFGLDSLLCFSNSNPEAICQAIEGIMLNQNIQEKIQLQDSEIYKYFELLELDCKNQENLYNHTQVVFLEFRKISQAYQKFIRSLNSNNLNFYFVLHQIILKIKEEADMKVMEFVKKNSEEILKMVDKQGNNLGYLHYICLKKEILLDLENVIKLAQQRMKESKFHIFNYLKKCPFCGLIWLKVVGCDKNTTCGNRVNAKIDNFLLDQPKENITIIRNKNNEITYRVNCTSDTYDYLVQIYNKLSQEWKLKQIQFNKIILEQILIELFGKNYKIEIIKRYIQGEIDGMKLLRKVYELAEFKNINQVRIQSAYAFQYRPNMDQTQNQIITRVKQSSIPQFPFRQKQLVEIPFQQNTNQNFFKLQKINQTKSVGCGNEIIWEKLPSLSQQELDSIVSTELLEYFADQENVQNEELKWLSKHYKDIVNQAIKDWKIEVLDKNNQKQDQSTFNIKK